MRLFGATITALDETIQHGSDPLQLIDDMVGWHRLVAAKPQVDALADLAGEDALVMATERYATVRRFSPAFDAGRSLVPDDSPFLQFLNATCATRAMGEPDELVGCTLYRGCSANEMTEHKVLAFAEVMVSAGGWGKFPMISGYVETLDANDVKHCQQLVDEGNASVWLDEHGW